MYHLEIEYYDGRPSESITDELEILRNFADDFRLRDIDKTVKVRRVIRETGFHLGHRVVIYYFPKCKKTYYVD